MVTIVNMRTRSEVEGFAPQMPYSLPFASGGLIGNQYTPRYEDYVALMRGSVIGRKATKGDKKKNPAAAAGATRFGTPATSAGQVGTNPDAAREARIAELKLELQNLQGELHNNNSNTDIPTLMARMQAVVTELESLDAKKAEQPIPAVLVDSDAAREARIAELKLELQNLQGELHNNNSNTDISTLMARMRAVVTEFESLDAKKAEQLIPAVSTDPEAEAAKKSRVAELEQELQDLHNEPRNDSDTVLDLCNRGVHIYAVMTEIESLGAEKAGQSVPAAPATAPEEFKKIVVTLIADYKLELQELHNKLHSNDLSATDISTLVARMREVVTKLESLPLGARPRGWSHLSPNDNYL